MGGLAGCGLAGDDGVVSEVVVAFYRNMNLGHAGSPDRAGLEGALRDAGARLARSFQTNGTCGSWRSAPRTRR